ncbi:S8 family serine peptidase [Flavobacterium kingsejongi]|uniref:Peptidase S8/S53 domain-containing protein n=1 Tax=Flavobacterium kingsejongi TaxID=1678728 RepID=A0A2S1LKW5_9FLAO|nr:S8 family serine peptidase [Flavobacterium kingsejongi]AWG24301.1 hypothetical protein FK004_03205 [Flavobacterium kingsejongi]
MESIRIIRKLKPKIESSTAHVSDAEKILYQKALLEYESLKKNRKSDKEYIEAVADVFIKGKEIIKDFFPNNEYDVKKIDSILLAYPNDTERNYYISYFKQCLEKKVTEKWIANYKKNVEEMTNKCINIDYNDRLIPGDNPYDIKDSSYGNNNVSGNIDVLEHGTTVVGILSSERNNGIGINGISNYLKIMPLSIASYGNENDKDIALAIRYAVDNGAKVINMSFGKLLSMNENWVLDAIRYAADNDVLIISSAGNGGKKINSEKPYYPNDSNYLDNEVSDNFMKVGSISYNLNEKFISSFSNYSDSQVDLFAPGEKIYTTLPNNQYDFVNGTSYSTPIVSGVAALLRSYYPNLSASEVKHILMDSGLSIPINVQVPGATEGTLKPFSELSKSGKVVNAYNALLRAKEVAKKKKKKRA